MTVPSRFNIRAYGIWILDGKLLVNEEIIKGRKVIKLPGGGVELGEGIIDGLQREWMEELGLAISIIAHFYTTDFFLASAFDDSQVISVYYLVKGDPHAAIRNTMDTEHTYWMPLSELTDTTFTLPIDRLVGRMLMKG